MRNSILLLGVLMFTACSDTPTPIASARLQPRAAAATVIGADGSPTPDTHDRIVIDLRSSLQKATTLSQAWKLFPDGDFSSARPSVGRVGWSFAKNFDGAGTSALRADWAAGKCTEQTNRVIAYLPSPHPKTLYVQWRSRFGAAATDATANGTADTYSIENKSCASAAAYAMRIFRDGVDGGETGSLNLWYAGAPLAVAAVEQDALGDARLPGNQGWTFSPSRTTGRAVKFTMLLQPQSSSTTRDGIIRVWIDGRLYFERTGAALGTQSIQRLELPGWRYGNPLAQSEYIWDLLAWEGGAAQPPSTSTPPPPPPPTSSTPPPPVIPSQPSSGVPQPGATDQVLLDTRQTLQQVTTLDQAFALFPGGDHTAARGGIVGANGWSFTTNYDGNGTHALRADWAANPGGDDGIRIISYLPTPKPREMYVQWKSRHGKTSFDPSANGNVNDFPIYPASQTCKRLLVLRDGVGGGDIGRIDYTWTRDIPTSFRVQMNDQNWAAASNSSTWPIADWLYKPYTTTIHVRANSSAGTADGIYRMWVDGSLVVDVNGGAPLLSYAFDRWQWPDTCHNMPRAASEYFWDILVWTPHG